MFSGRRASGEVRLIWFEFEGVLRTFASRMRPEASSTHRSRCRKVPSSCTSKQFVKPTKLLGEGVMVVDEDGSTDGNPRGST